MFVNYVLPLFTKSSVDAFTSESRRQRKVVGQAK